MAGVILDFSFLAGSWPLLAGAAANTVIYSAAALVIGLPAAVVLCLCCLSRQPVLRAFGRFYVSFFRGVPLLVLLLFAYYGVSGVGLSTTPEQAAIAALAVCEAAYLAECMRGGFLAVPKGFVEASLMSGLNRRQNFVYIVLPTAVRLTLPSIINEVTMAIKASSLISVVGIAELTRVSQNLASSTFQ
ncbi:amino acid ABC transporter permease, partial [Mesorhizobium sp. M7D.F.Ca.US.004.03.1.1]|uniref:amino acid ABC transporter permease n=1 Tax=Mesorhizobium sp. M7D.F.Ca.US.004.03.1.1 TaxID=2496702 RepID=UPI000FD1B5A2